MRSFIQRLAVTCCIMLALLGVVEYLARLNPNTYKYKTEWMKQHATEVETLILGNSLTFYDIVPDSFKTKSFCLANSSQTPKYDWLLFARDTLRYEKLKTVIIPSFSFLYDIPLEYDKMHSYRIAYYRLYCNCEDYSVFSPYSWELGNFIMARNKVLNVLHLKEYAKQCNELGNYFTETFEGENFRLSEEEIKIKYGRFVTIVKMREKIEKIDYTDSLMNYCDRHNIQVLVVGTPVYSLLADTLTTDEANLSILDEEARKYQKKHPNMIYHSYTHDKSFEYKDFYDPIHLNEYGAKKLSHKMKKDLNL